MERKNDNYFIPANGVLIKVSEKDYKDYFQPIWKTRAQAQRDNVCFCPKAQLPKCDGVCYGCPFHVDKKEVSLNTTIYRKKDKEVTLGDSLIYEGPSPEDITLKKELFAVLTVEIGKLTQSERHICELIMQGKSDSEISASLGIPRTTFIYQKNKVLDKLREALKDFAPSK